MKKFIYFSIFLITFSASIVRADAPNTGFIPGTIWYSRQPLNEGDTVKIYTAVWNGDDSSLSAKVEFYDKNVILGSRDIVVPPSSLKDVSVSWQVTAGDHVISAKIVASKFSLSGKSQSVLLDRRATGEDRQFVSKVIKEVDGTPVSSVVVIKDQVDQAGAKISSIIPASISTPISQAFGSVDDFRDTTYTKISATKNETQKKIDLLNTPSPTSKDTKTVDTKDSTQTAGTEKPIAYVKFFFYSILAFLFGSKFVFYGLSTLIVFLILRFFYRKIRNR